MEYNQQELESRLAGMCPSAPDAALLDCVELAAASDLLHLTPIEAALERRLHAFRPAQVPNRVAVVFLATVGDMEFPKERNLIPFPGKAAPLTNQCRHPRKRMYAAAAAVALLGGLSALLIPIHGNTNAFAKNNNPPRTPNPPVTSQITQGTRQGFVPASFGRGVADVKENGVVWDKAGRPCRVVRVIYMDYATMVNYKGERVKTVQPRIEYLLVPEKMD